MIHGVPPVHHGRASSARCLPGDWRNSWAPHAAEQFQRSLRIIVRERPDDPPQRSIAIGSGRPLVGKRPMFSGVLPPESGRPMGLQAFRVARRQSFDPRSRSAQCRFVETMKRSSRQRWPDPGCEFGVNLELPTGPPRIYPSSNIKSRSDDAGCARSQASVFVLSLSKAALRREFEPPPKLDAFASDGSTPLAIAHVSASIGCSPAQPTNAAPSAYVCKSSGSPLTASSASAASFFAASRSTAFTSAKPSVPGARSERWRQDAQGPQPDRARRVGGGFPIAHARCRGSVKSSRRSSPPPSFSAGALIAKPHISPRRRLAGRRAALELLPGSPSARVDRREPCLG